MTTAESPTPPQLIELSGTNFHGCTNPNPTLCACETWTPIECAACDVEMVDGDAAYTLPRPAYPWLPDDHQEQEWEHFTWHKACDERQADLP